ncbi:MAG: hypothetical protein ABIP94_03695, partial [Planctomycetota bacterium]
MRRSEPSSRDYAPITRPRSEPVDSRYRATQPTVRPVASEGGRNRDLAPRTTVRATTTPVTGRYTPADTVRSGTRAANTATPTVRAGTVRSGTAAPAAQLVPRGTSPRLSRPRASASLIGGATGTTTYRSSHYAWPRRSIGYSSYGYNSCWNSSWNAWWDPCYGYGSYYSYY